MNVVVLFLSAVLVVPVWTAPRLQAADGGMLTAAPTTDSEGGVTQDEAEGLAADLEALREARGWTAKRLAAYVASEAALDAVSELLGVRFVIYE